MPVFYERTNTTCTRVAERGRRPPHGGLGLEPLRGWKRCPYWCGEGCHKQWPCRGDYGVCGQRRRRFRGGRPDQTLSRSRCGQELWDPYLL